MSEEQGEDEVDAGIEVEFWTVSSDRLKGFSDAVWAIIATIMIVPTMHVNVSEELKETHNIDTVVKETLPQVALYFLAFMIVCSTWASHVRTFETMEKVTDLSLAMNLLILLAASFLPYFYSLMTNFRTPTTVVLYSSIQIGIGLCQFVIVFHAFNYPGLLKKKMTELTDSQKKHLMLRILSNVFVAPVFAIFAIFLSFASVNLAIICLGLILIYPWIQSFITWFLTKIPKCNEIIGRTDKQLMNQILLTERIKKKRVEAFADGVFAITSTLLALDITEKYLPTKQIVKTKYGGHVMNALSSAWGVFLSYILTFMLVGIMWYCQLQQYKNYHHISRFMILFNNLALACVGLLPLAFTFILHFKIPSAVQVGMRFGTVALFSSGVLNLIMYVLALFFDRYRKDENWISRDIKPHGKEFIKILYINCGTCAFSALTFGLTYLSNELISIFVGGSLMFAFALVLLFWETVRATCFGEEDLESRGSYRTLKFSEAILEDVGETAAEE